MTAACASAAPEAEEQTGSAADAMRCLTCPPDEGGVDIYITGPSRWHAENIRRWLREDRIRRGNTDRPTHDREPNGRKLPEPAYCRKDIASQDQCPNEEAMFRDCRDSASNQLAWGYFCTYLNNWYPSELVGRCRSMTLKSMDLKRKWCNWHFGPDH